MAAQLVLPARPGLTCARGVEADPGHLEEDVPWAAVDRDPLAAPRLAPGHQRAGRERALQEAGGRERERDRAGAVVAGVEPAAVAAAPLVGRAGDRVPRLDDPLDRIGRLERR